MILCGNPHAQYTAHKGEIDAAVLRVMEHGRYVLGEEVEAFEREFAAYVGAGEAVGVGSGTEALHLALAACGIGPGDEVVTVSHTAVATVAAIELAGATPVLVDIDPVYYTLDPAKLEKALNARTKAVIPVHIYGQSADLMPILELARKRGIKVIEDCAQSHGALYGGQRTGCFGDLGCFSFYPTKNLGAIGDGGMVVSNDPALAERARLLREYGWAERYVSHVAGWNSRLDELQAAILRVKLRYLDEDNAKRRQLAALYERLLASTPLKLPRQRPRASHVFHLYAVRAVERDGLKAHLEGRGIVPGIHYPVPVHLQPAYRGRLAGAERLPVSEMLASEELSLPLYPELTEQEAETVCAAVREYYGGAG